MQDRGTLLVTPADAVDQRYSERDQCPREQHRLAHTPSLRARLTQARDARLDGTRGHGRAPRLELPDRGRPIADRGLALEAVVVGGPAHPGVGRAAQLPAEQHIARIRVMPSRSDLARPGQAAHQQLVRALVERIQSKRARGEGSGAERIARRQRPQRRLAQHGLTDAGHAPTLHQQPGVEDRSGDGIDAFQEFSAGELRIGIAGGKRERVDDDSRRQPELERIVPQRSGSAERAAQLRERPPQRAEGVVRVAEDQGGQPRASRPAARRAADRPARPTPCGRGAARPGRRHARSPAGLTGGSRAWARDHRS